MDFILILESNPIHSHNEINNSSVFSTEDASKLELETPVEQTATMEMQVEQAPPAKVPVEPF